MQAARLPSGKRAHRRGTRSPSGPSPRTRTATAARRPAIFGSAPSRRTYHAPVGRGDASVNSPPPQKFAPWPRIRPRKQLYFGTAKPGGSVSSEEWSAFLAQVVTPRFPAGLSVWPASGQWQSADGSITKENSFVLSLVHAQDEATERAIQAVIAQYKSQFQQEAVLRVKSYACTSL